jgi:hypothetical protein
MLSIVTPLEVITLTHYFKVNLISAFVHGTLFSYLSSEYYSQKWLLECLCFLYRGIWRHFQCRIYNM